MTNKGMNMIIRRRGNINTRSTKGDGIALHFETSAIHYIMSWRDSWGLETQVYHFQKPPATINGEPIPESKTVSTLISKGNQTNWNGLEELDAPMIKVSQRKDLFNGKWNY